MFHHIPHILHCVCVCVTQANLSVHICDTYYKVGELAHKVPMVSNKSNIWKHNL